MGYKNLAEFIKYLNIRTYHSAWKYGKDTLVSISLEHEGKKEMVVDHLGRKNISNIKNLVRFNPVDKIHVELHEEKETVLLSFDMKNNESQEKGREVSQKKESKSIKVMQNNENNDFKGFGQAEIEEMVNKRLTEEKTRTDLIELREKVILKDKKIEKLKGTIGQLEEEIQNSGKEQQRLEGIIEAKKSIRYWAGFAGDMMESIGIDKKKLRQPLAGLIAEEDAPKQIEAPIQDDSGIVEEVANIPNNDKVVNMIADFLKTLDNEILGTIYEIMVFIEKDPLTAHYLCNHLNEREKAK